MYSRGYRRIQEAMGDDGTDDTLIYQPPNTEEYTDYEDTPYGWHSWNARDWVDQLFIREGVGVRNDYYRDDPSYHSSVRTTSDYFLLYPTRFKNSANGSPTSRKIDAIIETTKVRHSKMLSTQAIIATFVGRVWRAQSYDRTVTSEIVKAKNTSRDAGRFNKNLMPGDPLLKAIKKQLSAVRHYHYATTLPWEWKGGQLLPGKLYMPYSAEIGKLIDEFDDLVDQFCDPVYYNAAIDKAKKTLGDMFVASDYPSDSQIKDTFFAAIEFMSVPSAGDYRIDLPAEEIQQLKADHYKKEREIVKNATEHLYNKLGELAKHAEERLKDPKNVFHDTLPANIKKFTDILPELNIEDDQNLNKLAQELQDAVGVHDAETLREDEVVREAAAEDAGSIVDQIKSQMGAFAS